MARLTLALLVAASSAFARAAVLRGGRSWEAIPDGIPALEAVEKSLQQVSHAKLDPKQQAAAKRVVKDVEQAMADIKGNPKLTKEQKNAKVKGAIDELENLQAQWQLSVVEVSLKQVVSDPHLTSQQVVKAKKVVGDVDAALDEVESGKLDAATRKKKVAFAIQKLQGLETELANSTLSTKEAALERKIAEKKLLLKKAETQLKMADLEKQLLSKKLQLKELVEEKDSAQKEKRVNQESAAERDQIAKLIAAARNIASVRKSTSAKGPNSTKATEGKKDKDHTEHGLAKDAPEIKAIVAQLDAKIQKSTVALAKFDADFAQRVVALKKAILDSKKDNTRGHGLLERTLKNQQRLHLKARAVRAAELAELKAGMQSIEKGDVAALSTLLGKMQKESKSLQAAAGTFLH